MSSLWDAVDAEKDLPWASVAVKLIEGSTDAKNFAQICKLGLCLPLVCSHALLALLKRAFNVLSVLYSEF